MKRMNLNGSQLASRRSILKYAGGCAAMTNTSLLSTMFNLSATNAVVAQSGDLSDYKAIVCLFMFGGNDSFNMLTPLDGLGEGAGGADTGERKGYLDARGGMYSAGSNNGALGLPVNEATRIVDSASSRNFMIHPAMPEMKALYDTGKMSFVANVGSLVAPTTRANYDSRSNLPLGLFSHADLQRHWMTSVPQTRSQVTGWAGRMADLVTGATNMNENISMNISLNDVNMLQTGGSVVPYIIRDDGAREISWYIADGSGSRQQRIFSTLTDDLLTRSYGNLLERTFAQQNSTAVDAAIEFNTAKDAQSSVDSYFPMADSNGAPGPLNREPTALEKKFRMVAKSIAARETLGQNRQVFFVSVGGWDNHDELINNHVNNLGDVSRSLGYFQAALDGIGVSDNVLTFTASDFARTLNGNGGGSDHAWGGNQIVMGGPVSGGKIHGQYPLNLAPGGTDLDLGRGRLLPTTSVDEMAAEMAMWYGINNDNNLEAVLPNIRNFPSASSGSRPIGFLS